MPDLVTGLVIPDLHLKRMEPCSAVTGPETVCGATPASPYRRYCGQVSHEAVVWICPVHAVLASIGGAACRACAENGGVRLASVLPLSGPVRL